MGVRWGVLLLGLGLLSACTVLPTGPSVFVLPAVGKSMDVFQVEEGRVPVLCAATARGCPRASRLHDEAPGTV